MYRSPTCSAVIMTALLTYTDGVPPHHEQVHVLTPYNEEPHGFIPPPCGDLAATQSHRDGLRHLSEDRVISSAPAPKLRPARALSVVSRRDGTVRSPDEHHSQHGRDRRRGRRRGRELRLSPRPGRPQRPCRRVLRRPGRGEHRPV